MGGKNRSKNKRKKKSKQQEVGTTTAIAETETQPDSKPDSVDSKPDSADSKPDSTDSKPDSADSKPDSADSKPDSADSKPDSASAAKPVPEYVIERNTRERLPFEHQDNDMVKSCIKRDLELNPRSSTANHRMAMFYINVEKSMISAEKYCTIAVNEDIHNFPALCELIQIYMSNPNRNKDKLQALFDQKRSIASDSTWSSKKSGQINYLHALFVFMMNQDPTESIKELVNIEKERSGTCCDSFKSLGYQMKKFKWPQELISFDKLSNALQRAAGPNATAKEFLTNRELLFKMKKDLEISKKHEQKFEEIQWEKEQKKKQEVQGFNNQNASSSTVIIGGIIQPCTDIRHRDTEK